MARDRLSLRDEYGLQNRGADEPHKDGPAESPAAVEHKAMQDLEDQKLVVRERVCHMSRIRLLDG